MHKKKVVFVINNFAVGGVERLLFDIVSNFDKEKYDIQIITVLGSGPLESSFRKLGIKIYFAGPFRYFSKKIVYKIFWTLSIPATLIRIIFFLIKSKPDVVVSSLYQADILCMIAAKIVGVKKRVLIQHDITKFTKFLKFFKKIFALQFTTQIVSISETVKNFLISYFDVKNKKIITILNGVDYEKFKKGIKLNQDFNNLVIGIVGRTEEVKGHRYLFEALKILKEKYNLSPKTIVGGDGSLCVDLEKYTLKNNLLNIKFLGSIDDVPYFLSQVDILVVPSVEEGLGLVVLEGMISGKAIVASDIEAMHELIKDNETGLLFKSKNVDSLADTLLRVLSSEELYKKLQKNATLFTENNKKIFEIKEVSSHYQEFIDLSNYN